MTPITEKNETEKEIQDILSDVSTMLKAQNQVFEHVRFYAKNVPLSWGRFAPSSVMGNFVGAIRYLQRYYALGVNKKDKAIYQNEVLKKDIINAFFAFENNNPTETKEAALAFSKILRSSDWARFMVEYPAYRKPWEIFARSQQIVLQNIFPDEPEQLFRVIWFPTIKTTSFLHLKTQFFAIEQMVARGYSTMAKESFDTLSDAFLDINDITPDNRVELTRIRRLVAELLRQKPYLQSSQAFDMYTKLIQSEIGVYPIRTEISQELALESAQDILFFINLFIDSKSGSDISLLLGESVPVFRY